MQYRKLGRTGVEVSTQCLGSMMFGGFGNKDHDECVKMIHRALDAGINFVDTADIYSSGESEEIVGKALKGRRDDIVLATKCFNPMGEDRNRRGGSRRWIVQAVEDSLRRLDTDHIDLYQVHRHDWATDLDETLGALTDLTGPYATLGKSIVQAQQMWADEANAEGGINGPPERPAPFRVGSALIALRTGAPILPLAIAGTAELYLGKRIAARILPSIRAVAYAQSRIQIADWSGNGAATGAELASQHSTAASARWRRRPACSG